MLAVAVGCVFGVVGPALAYSHDDRVEFIRGQGSDSTYVLMQRLDTAFNNTLGCLTTPSSGNSPFNSTCFQENSPVTYATENHDHDVAISMYPVGSGNGIKILNQYGQPSITKIDYARSSRAPKFGDNVNLRFVAYAKDAVPWGDFRTGTGDANSPAAGVSDLTVTQLQNIYINCTGTDNTTDYTQSTLRGQINNWNQIGGANAPILVWTAQSGSGTRSSFDTFLGGDSSACIPAQLKDSNFTNGENVIFENNPDPIRHCEDWLDHAGVSHAADTDPHSCDANRDGIRDANATQESIFYMSWGLWNSWPTQDPYGNGAGIDLGSIGGVAPSAQTITDGTYAATRLLYNVYRGNGYAPASTVTAAAYDYISEEGWICAANSTHVIDPFTGLNYGVEGDNAVTNAGFVALPEATIQNQSGTNIQAKCRVTPVPTS